jgi:hypothetical protein
MNDLGLSPAIIEALPSPSSHKVSLKEVDGSPGVTRGDVKYKSQDNLAL